MRVVTFGEVMLRMMPEHLLRLQQVIPGRLEVTFGGAEANVAVSIARQGGRAAFATSLPDNVLTDACMQELRRHGVETDCIERSPRGRFGIYFVETGANQRGGTVTYDREGSAIALRDAAEYDWGRLLEDSDWLHLSGITPAVSREAASAARAAVEQGKSLGLTVSCDLNFRKKLWNWEPGTPPVELARKTMRSLMPFVDLVIANEEDAELALGISAPETNVEAGKLNVAGYQQVVRRIVEEFPNVRRVAVTLRESHSASHNNWGALLYDAAQDRIWLAPTDADGHYAPYEIRNIVDRVGAGDAFAGGLIFALRTPELSEPETALRYAVAASCLKHSILGDFNVATRAEIESLMSGSGSGRVQR